MTTVSGLDSDVYNRNFSIEEAKELISTCLDKFDKSNPDCVLLLETISKLTVLINTAKYDYTVLENLISENAALGEQYNELKLEQIFSDVYHMSFKADALEEKCEILQEKFNQSEPAAASSDPRIPDSLSLTKLGKYNVNLQLSSKTYS